jgi:hypothetical protein
MNIDVTKNAMCCSFLVRRIIVSFNYEKILVSVSLVYVTKNDMCYSFLVRRIIVSFNYEKILVSV